MSRDSRKAFLRKSDAPGLLRSISMGEMKSPMVEVMQCLHSFIIDMPVLSPFWHLVAAACRVLKTLGQEASKNEEKESKKRNAAQGSSVRGSREIGEPETLNPAAHVKERATDDISPRLVPSPSLQRTCKLSRQRPYSGCPFSGLHLEIPRYSQARQHFHALIIRFPVRIRSFVYRIACADGARNITRNAPVMEHNTHPAPSHTRRRSGSLIFGGAGAKNSASNGRRHSPLDEGKAVPEEPYGSDISGATTSDDMEMDEMRSDDELTDDEETGLTHAERKKRRRRKSRNQRLDQRVAPGEDVQQAEERMATASLIKNMVINAVLIGLWYTFSISISVYNKWMFSSENLDFHFPLFTTSVHMLVQFVLASLVLWFLPRFRPRAEAGDQDGHGTYSQLNDQENIDQEPKPSTKKPLMTKSFYLTRISPCGAATALDIGLGNFSLRFITLTFFTMCKSSVLAFVLLFAFLFRLETPTWKLCAVILFMTVGVIMMVAGEASFNALGFLLVMSASFCSGFRWSLTQILLLRNAATSNPFSSIFFLTPSMFLVLFLLALPIETPAAVLDGLAALSEAKGAPLSAIIILFPGCLAFMMVAAEFALLKRTSVVTLSVCGIFKEVLTISAASYSFGDPLSPINVSGLVVTIASIAGYNWLKYSKMKSEARKEAQEMMEGEETEDSKAGASRRQEGGENGYMAHPDEFSIGRDSTETSGLMRESLAVATNVEPGGAAAHGRALSLGSAGLLRDGQTQSPVKRPEDLE